MNQYSSYLASHGLSCSSYIHIVHFLKSRVLFPLDMVIDKKKI